MHCCVNCYNLHLETAMTITPEMKHALELAGHEPVRLADPESGDAYYLVKEEVFDRLRSVLDDSLSFDSVAGSLAAASTLEKVGSQLEIRDATMSAKDKSETSVPNGAPNEKALATLLEMRRRRRGVALTEPGNSLDYLREARSGGMYGYDGSSQHDN